MSTMFDCVIFKAILKHEEEDLGGTRLRYDIRLPFPPYIGLKLFEEGWASGAIRSVSWHANDNRFECWVKEDKPSVGDDGYYFTHEWLVKAALMDRWKIDGGSE